MCPDTPSFTLYVDTWIIQGSKEYSNLELRIVAKTGATEARIVNTSIQTVFVYPYYDAPIDYRSNGHKLSYASDSYATNYYDSFDGSVGHPANAFFLIKKKTIEIFKNLWVDLSQLNFGHFADVHYSY